MGQAKRRGTLEDRKALAITMSLSWDEALAEKWERERPERELRESIRRKCGVGVVRGGNHGRLAASLILTSFALQHRFIR